MEASPFNPLLYEDDEIGEWNDVPMICSDSKMVSGNEAPRETPFYVDAESFIFGEGETVEEEEKSKYRKKQNDTPVIITALQHKSALEAPVKFSTAQSPNIVHRYSPRVESPDKTLFTRGMFPVDEQRKEEDMPFIHFEDKPEPRTPMTISQKVAENLDGKQVQDAAARRFAKNVIQEFPAKGTYEPVYNNPFRYPFVQGMMQTPPDEILGTNRLPHTLFQREKIEAVDREYDADFLREPVYPERPCVNNGNCVGTKVSVPKGQKVILREYYVPSNYAICKKKGCWPDDPQECLLCQLLAIGKLYFNTKADQMGIEGDASISPFYHKVRKAFCGE
jgi:hypothetical protein